MGVNKPTMIKVSPKSERTMLSSTSGETSSPKRLQEDIRVAVRMRPLNERENQVDSHVNGSNRSWQVLKEHSSIVQIASDGLPIDKSVFTFDGVFSENDSTKDVYAYIAKGMAKAVVEGRNASIFSYGQTSSGKTHTMQGANSIKDGMKNKEGLVHLAAADLFHEIEQRKDRNFFITVSVMEIYNEELRDLLTNNGSESSRIQIRQHKTTGVFVTTTRREALTYAKLIQWLSYGERQRIVAQTSLNRRSSRSHIIFSINVESTPLNERGSSSTITSTFNLIDLAGSESVRHRSSYLTDRRRQEGGNINKSLLTLSLVVQALASRKRQSHVNYRDSKLTRVLQHSLSGNALLGFVCCATLSSLFTEETKSTLQFASRIKTVKTNAQVNFIDEKTELERAQSEVSRMKKTIHEIADTVKKLETRNKKLESMIETLSVDRDNALERVKLLEKFHRSRSMLSERNQMSGVQSPPSLNSWNQNSKMKVSTMEDKAPSTNLEAVNEWDVPTELTEDDPAVVSIVSEPTSYDDALEDSERDTTQHEAFSQSFFFKHQDSTTPFDTTSRLNSVPESGSLNPNIYSEMMDDLVSASDHQSDPLLEYGSQSESESGVSME
jgi:centromeric protein E